VLVSSNPRRYPVDLRFAGARRRGDGLGAADDPINGLLDLLIQLVPGNPRMSNRLGLAKDARPPPVFNSPRAASLVG